MGRDRRTGRNDGCTRVDLFSGADDRVWVVEWGQRETKEGDEFKEREGEDTKKERE